MNNSSPQTHHELLFAKYGRKPPVQAIARLEEELHLMGKDFMYDVILLANLREAAEEEGFSLDDDGTLSGSLIAWLYGASEVNPLPPHYRCPKCKKVIFTGKGDGYDLPPMECCGTPMIRDGHDIPLATVREHLKNPRNYSLGFRTAKSFAEKAEEIVREHYEELGVELVPFEDRHRGCQFFYLVPERDLAGFSLDDEEPGKPGPDRLKRGKYRELHITCVGRKDRLWEMRKQTGRTPAVDDLLDKSVMAVTEAQIRGEILKEGAVLLQSAEPSFDGLLRVLGYYYSSHTEENAVYTGDGTRYTDLFTSREEVYHLVNRAMKTEYGLDSEFPSMIMESTRRGLYVRNGMTPETELAVRALGIEEYWVAQMKNTYYLSSRATLTNTLLDRLKLVWYELQVDPSVESDEKDGETTRTCIECGKEFNPLQARAEYNAYFAPYAVEYRDHYSGDTCASCAIRNTDAHFIRE